jgi:hypothetical protein
MRGRRRGTVTARLLGLRVRIPPGTWMFVSCDCCVLSGRGLCVGLITRPEESYRMWCVSECDRVAWILRRPWPTGGCRALGKYVNVSVKWCSCALSDNRIGVSFVVLWRLRLR